MQQIPQRPTIRPIVPADDKMVDPNVSNASKHGAQSGDGSLSLIDEDVSAGPKKILNFDHENVHRKENFKRKTAQHGTGACRVRSFHCKYSDDGLRFMDNQINQWLDDHDDIDVKFVTSTVMTFQGKIAEPQLVLNVWY